MDWLRAQECCRGVIREYRDSAGNVYVQKWQKKRLH